MKFAVKNHQKKEKFNFLFEGTSYIQKIEEKLKDELNNFCVECGEENPKYISINNGIFICEDCVQNHLKFPKSISTIKKNNIKSLTLNEIQFLLCGGNRTLLNFICNEYPKLAELSPNILYRTQAMVYYRQNLEYLINGSIPPMKPSIKIAYNIPNFLNDINTNSLTNTNDDDYDYNKDIQDLMIKYDKGNDNKNNIKENNYTLNGNGYEDDNFLDENNKFYKTSLNFRQSRNNQKSICNTESNKLYNKFTMSNNTNSNTIGNDSIYDNYYINNRLKRMNNKKILFENKFKFTDNNNIGNSENDDNNFSQHFPQRIKINLNKNKNKKGKIKNKINNSNKNMNNSNSIINNKSKNINYNINSNIRNSVNADIYRKPKLLLYHNGSQGYLNNQRTINQRSNSYEKVNNNYFYSLPNMISKKSKIDSIQLDFSKDAKNKNIWKKRNMIKNLSHEMYKKTKKFLKGNKNIHKSFSQKMFNNITKNKNKRNKNIFINQTQNDFYIPEKKSKLNFYFSNSNSKSKIDIINKMTISNIEEIQICPSRNKIINYNKINNMNNTNTIASSEKYSTEENLNLKNYNNNNNKNEFKTLPIKINIKVNKKGFVDNNDKKEKIKQTQNNLNLNKKKEKAKENIYYTTKSKLFQLKKSGSLKKFVIKNNNNKKKVLLRLKQKNKINLNNNNSININKEIMKTFSQKNFSDNFHKYNANKNKSDKNNINMHMNSNSIRSRHKVGFQFK